MWTQKCDQKTLIPSKIGAENGEFCVPSLVSRFRPPFLGPPIMRTLKGGAVFRPRNRGHFWMKKPIFGQKKVWPGAPAKLQKVSAVSAPENQRVRRRGRIVRRSPTKPSALELKRVIWVAPPRRSAHGSGPTSCRRWRLRSIKLYASISMKHAAHCAQKRPRERLPSVTMDPGKRP